MGFIYISESCDIISTLGNPNFFFQLFFFGDNDANQCLIFVRLKGDAIWNKSVLEKNKKIILSLT